MTSSGPAERSSNRVSVRVPVTLLRAFGCLLLLGWLAACAGHAPQTSEIEQAKEYQARAKGGYTPPGTPDDPWGPYIQEAAARFDVPERWIREVMRVESGGKLYQGAQLITSWAGAMGLMQVMPQTYDELKARHNLGDDPFDPHDNVLAGAAYMREMYDIYGTPGFLAAYNAGPRRLDDYLANLRPLPDETRRYVAKIGPFIADSYPATRSPAEQYAMNDLPTEIAPGLRYGGGETVPARRPMMVAMAARIRQAAGRQQVQQARAEIHRGRGTPHVMTVASVGTRGWSLIPRPQAETLGPRRGGRGPIEIAAFGAESLPRGAARPAHIATRGVAASGTAPLHKARTHH